MCIQNLHKSIQANAFLTPKGPSYIFWQHRDFGQVHVTKDFIIFL